MKTRLKGDFATKKIMLDGMELSPAPSLAVRKHSPDGFNWGYAGSGPSQLALGVLLSTKDFDYATSNYNKFMHKVIAVLPQDNFEVEIDIDQELEK